MGTFKYFKELSTSRRSRMIRFLFFDRELDIIELFYIIVWNRDMHYLTVDHLANATQHTRKKHKVFSFLHEIKLLLIFWGIAFVGVTVFTNAQLFLASVENIIAPQKATSIENIKQNMKENNSKMIILIVDDSSFSRNMIREILSAHGAQGSYLPRTATLHLWW